MHSGCNCTTCLDLYVQEHLQQYVDPYHCARWCNLHHLQPVPYCKAPRAPQQHPYLLHHFFPARYVTDTAEELSAFDGVLLEKQADFALACLKHIAKQYHVGAGSSRNGSSRGHHGIILVGHSMGGVVARAALLRAWKDPELGKNNHGPVHVQGMPSSN